VYSSSPGDAGPAAALLHSAAENFDLLEYLPEQVAPITRSDAYAVQRAGASLRGAPTVGWKIAATSEAGQHHINVNGPLAGRILADRIYGDGDQLPLTGNALCLAELEFVFVMRSTIAPKTHAYDREDIVEAVQSLRLGVELPSTRYVDPTKVGENQLIADNSCSGDFLLGPVVSADWRALDLSAVSVDVDVDGPSGVRHAVGRGANVLGHPINALMWLINELSGLGITLERGQFVTTQTCCTPVPVSPGDALTASFAQLGSVACSFT
jgi:2-keto-4-pentenoate hydratase